MDFSLKCDIFDKILMIWMEWWDGLYVDWIPML